MPRYRIKLRITEPLPEELIEKKLSLNGSEVIVTTGKKPPSLEIFPIQSDGHEVAMLTARRALNNLLNYFTSVVQFRGTLEPGYEYSSLDRSEERGIVLTADPGIIYLTKVEVPDGFSLSTERRAAAFVRRGDSSNDPFDRFRNYYLAVDAVGKSLRSVVVKDGAVILETFAEVTRPAVVLKLATKLRSVLQESPLLLFSPVKALNEALYKSFRCSLMHSGSAADFTPFNPEDELQVWKILPIMRGVAWQYVKYERDKLTKAV
jgi:hypothetical protein